MIDIDRMIERQGFEFLRYVDDFRIVVDDPAAAHTALCRLAEHLMLTEGLSLNAAKTRIVGASQVVDEIENKFSQVFTAEERNGLDRYIQAIYDGEDVTDALADYIEPNILEEKLLSIVRSETIDYNSAKLILKALRATGVGDPLAFVDKFAMLLYYVPRDFCILIGSLAQRAPEQSEGLSTRIISIVRSKPYAEMALARIWVNHLFVSGALAITDDRLAVLIGGDTVIERRQALLLRGRLQDRAFFREAKTRFSDLSDWEKPTLMIAASCLAKSEFETWLGFCKERYSDIFSDDYILWLKSNQDDLISRLDVDFIIKSQRQRMVESFGEFEESASDLPF